MTKKEVVIIADYEQQSPLTLSELCEICHLSQHDISVYVEYEIIQPQGKVPQEWVFDLAQLQRMKTALRLQRDLELNLAGAAVVLNLLEEMEMLRNYVGLLERHYSKE